MSLASSMLQSSLYSNDKGDSMLDSTVDSISNPLTNYWNSFVDFLPQLVGAIVVIVVGLIVASVVASIVHRLLQLAENNKQTQKFLQHWDIRLRISKFVGKFVWWVLFLVFLSAAVQVLHVEALTKTINSLVAYLPSLFAAVVVAVVTLVGAKVVKGLVADALNGFNFSATRAVSTAAYIVVLVFGLTLAAAQLGLDMTIVTANVTVIVAGIMLAFGLAFGLGGRDAASRTIANMQNSKPTKKR